EYVGRHLLQRVAGGPPLGEHGAQAEGVDVLELEAVAARVLEVPVGRHEDGDRVGHDLAQELDHRGLALLRGGEHLAQRLDAEADVALLVAGDVPHSLAERRHRARLREVVLVEVLAGLGQGRLDDHVIERDRLGELGQGAVARQLLAHAVEPVEDVAVAPAVVAAGVLEGVGDAAVHARDLLEEAVEEDGVARLVHLLGGEEILLLLARGRLDVGREVVGDRVLAVEEHRVGPERRAPLDVGERLPALAVLGEVERGGAPVRLLPALVEVLVADRLDAHARSIANRPRRRAKPVRVPLATGAPATCRLAGGAPPAGPLASRPRAGRSRPYSRRSFGEVQGSASFASRSSPSSLAGTRSWASVSRSRRVTVPSSIVWPSTVTPQGVPISSWRR